MKKHSKKSEKSSRSVQEKSKEIDSQHKSDIRKDGEDSFFHPRDYLNNKLSKEIKSHEKYLEMNNKSYRNVTSFIIDLIKKEYPTRKDLMVLEIGLINEVKYYKNISPSKEIFGLLGIIYTIALFISVNIKNPICIAYVKIPFIMGIIFLLSFVIGVIIWAIRVYIIEKERKKMFFKKFKLDLVQYLIENDSQYKE